MKLRSEADCKEYKRHCKYPVEFIKVSFDESRSQGAIWRAMAPQLIGHEQLWQAPEAGDYLPYNVISKDGKLLPPPYCLYYRPKPIGFK